MKLYCCNHDQRDYDLLKKLCGVELEFPKIYDYTTDELVDNCILMIDLTNLKEHLYNKTSMIEKFNSLTNKKLMIVFHYKTIIPFADEIKDQVMAHVNIDKKNVYFILQTQADINSLKPYFSESHFIEADKWLEEYYNCSIKHHFSNILNYNIELPNCDWKRFSLCIRRFDEQRFGFMCDLIDNDLLHSFNYTFTNNLGAECLDSLDLNEIKKLVDTEKYKNRIENIYKFIDGLPYKVNHKIEDPYPVQVDYLIKKSMIHVIFETRVTTEEYEMISEKTYKSIFLKRPFILFCKPYSLRFLKECGYKTYSDFIDESYDEIVDVNLRQQAIMKELKRLDAMPFIEYEEMSRAMNNIAEYNFRILNRKIYSSVSDEFTLRALGAYDD